MSLIRVNYTMLVRYPLRVIDNVAVSRLDDDAPLRLAYQDLLADLDGAAGRLLGDQSAETRAHALRERTERVRATFAATRGQVQRRMVVEGQRRMDRYQRYRRLQQTQLGR